MRSMVPLPVAFGDREEASVPRRTDRGTGGEGRGRY